MLRELARRAQNPSPLAHGARRRERGGTLMTQSIHTRRAAPALAACAATLLWVLGAQAQTGTSALAAATAQRAGAAPAGTPSAQSAAAPPPLVNELAWAYAITPGPAPPAP